MGDNRQLRIDKMELWKVEVKAKLNNSIEAAMRNTQKAEAGTDETSFSQKVNEAGEENERQTVTIGQVTTAADITQELLDNISGGMCVYSTIRVAGDRLMEGTEEIYVERKKEEEVERRMITWKSRAEDSQESFEFEADMGDFNREEDKEAQAKTERWEKARKYTSTLDNNRDGGMTRYCYKRIGPVVFDVAGEFIDWIEKRLSWTNEQLATRTEENTMDKTEMEKVKRNDKALNRVLSATMKAIDTIMEAQWEGEEARGERKIWEKKFLQEGWKAAEQTHAFVALEETTKLDKRNRDMETKVKATADMTRQINVHLGLGTLRDEAELA